MKTLFEWRTPRVASSTHSLLKAFLLVQHLSQCLQYLDTQLLLFVHELLGVFNQSDRVTREVSDHFESCHANAVTGSQVKTILYWSPQVKSNFCVLPREVRQQQRRRQSNSTPGGLMMHQTPLYEMSNILVWVWPDTENLLFSLYIQYIYFLFYILF